MRHNPPRFLATATNFYCYIQREEEQQKKATHLVKEKEKEKNKDYNLYVLKGTLSFPPTVFFFRTCTDRQLLY